MRSGAASAGGAGRASAPWAASILLFALAAGCATTRAVETGPPIDSRPLLAALAAETERGQALSAELELSYRGDGGPYRGKAYLLLAAEHRLRLELSGPFGSTSALLVGDGENLWTYYPHKNEVWRNPLGNGFYSWPRGFPISLPLDPALIGDLLLALPPERERIASIRAYRAGSDSSLLLLEDAGECSWRYTFRSGPPLRLVKAEHRGCEQEVVVSYDPSAEGLPRDLAYRFSRGILTASFQETRRLTEPPSGAFVFSPPPGTLLQGE